MLGCIYKISVADSDFYIGSTFDFKTRKTLHKSSAKTDQRKLYQAIRANDGIFLMEKLHDYECENETELRIEERRVYDETRPTLNTNRPTITTDERIEYRTKYHHDNAEQIKMKNRQYYNDNAEQLKMKKKQYYNDNAEQIKMKNRQSHHDNAEQRNMKKRQYYNDNAEQIKMKKKERCLCECGCEVVRNNLKRHHNSKKHINRMNEINFENKNVVL
tara:strand:+ start:2996 stop:3646 length:651 start_codon:yes stop_codon:yes gene_type:complete